MPTSSLIPETPVNEPADSQPKAGAAQSALPSKEDEVDGVEFEAHCMG